MKTDVVGVSSAPQEEEEEAGQTHAGTGASLCAQQWIVQHLGHRRIQSWTPTCDAHAARFGFKSWNEVPSITDTKGELGQHVDHLLIRSGKESEPPDESASVAV